MGHASRGRGRDGDGAPRARTGGRTDAGGGGAQDRGLTLSTPTPLTDNTNMGKTRGIGSARKLRTHRREQLWADKDYKKSNLGSEYAKPKATGEYKQLVKDFEEANADKEIVSQSLRRPRRSNMARLMAQLN